jgi:AcrR family transcriptional regulator
MHENFVSLKGEKRDAVINAALAEFSLRGFTSASTNVIVSAAGISKGALFHYFTSKEDLFLFLCGYVFDIVVKEYYEKIPHADGDFLGRLSESSRLKQKLFEQYPPIFEFIKRLTQEPAGLLGDAITRLMRETMNLGYEKIMGNLDESLFKSDFPPDKIKDLIFWSLEGYGNRKMTQLTEAEVESGQLANIGIEQEFDEYMRILRKCYYK